MVGIISSSGLGLFDSSADRLGSTQGSPTSLGQAKGSANVNIATGNLSVQFLDESLSGTGADLLALRTYNSQGALNDGDTDGWRWNGEKKVVLTGTANSTSAVVTRTTGDGTETVFKWDGVASSNRYVSTAGSGAHDVITWNASGSEWVYVLDGARKDSEVDATLTGTANTASAVLKRTVDGAEYKWDGVASSNRYMSTTGSGTIQWNSYTSKWIYSQDASGDAIERYNGSTGWIKSYRDNSGNGFDYAFTGNLLATVKDLQSGQTLKFTYANSKLTEVSTQETATGNPLKQVYYAYYTTGSSSGKLMSVTTDLQPDGSLTDGKVYTTNYVYFETTDASNGKLKSISQSDGTSTLYTITSYTYDTSGRISTVTDQAGTTTFTYTSSTVTTVTLQNGSAWTYTYSSATGNNNKQLLKVESQAVNGVKQSVTYTYDTDGNVKTIVDGRNNTLTYDYDTKGNRIKEYDSLGNTLSRTFDSNNHLLTETRYSVASTTSPSGLETSRFVYDTSGRLRFAISAEGRVSETVYDSRGLVTRSLQYAGKTYTITTFTLSELQTWVTGLTADQKTQTQLTEFTYDYRGNLSGKTAYALVNSSLVGQLSADVRKTSFTYDQQGLLLQEVELFDDSSVVLSSYEYDGLGRVSKEVSLTGTKTTTYSGLTITVNNQATGLSTVSTTDASGRLVSIAQTGDSITRTTRYYYDTVGQLRVTEDPTGVRNYLFYDAAGRVNAKVDATGAVTAYTHDADGRVLTEIQNANRVAASTLSGWGTTPPASVSVTSDTTNDRKTTYTYDKAGRLLTTTVDGLTTLTNTYDGASRLTQTTQGDRTTRYYYDKDGKQTAVLNAENYLSENIYDSVGRVIQTIRYEKKITTVSSLSTMRTAVSSGDKLSTYYFYDSQGRQTGVVDEQGFLTETMYYGWSDNNGTSYKTIYLYKNAVSVGTNEVLSSVRSRAGVIGYFETNEYYLDGRLMRKDTTERSEFYEYDSAGRLVRKTQGIYSAEPRKFFTQYNAFNEIKGIVSGEGAATLTGTSTDAQIATAISNYGTRYDIDGAGRRIAEYGANGQKTLIFYDKEGRVAYTAKISGLTPSGPIADVVQFIYNAFGQLSEIRSLYVKVLASGLNGGIDLSLISERASLSQRDLQDGWKSYKYDKLGNVTNEYDGERNETIYGYNSFGEQTTIQRFISGSVFQLTEWTRDKLGRVNNTRQDNILTSQITYDGLGRIKYAYDAKNQLTENIYSDNGRTVQIKDPLGRIIKTEIDFMGRTLKVTDALNNITNYEYDDANRTIKVTHPDGVSITTWKNVHGEVVKVQDGNGGITQYTYTKDGTLDKVTDALGVIITDNDYDASGRLYESKDANGTITRYSYDSVNRVYLKTVDPTGLNLNTRYEFDSQGRQTDVTTGYGTAEASTTKYVYDRKGQITQMIVDPNGLQLSTKFVYDGLGQTVEVHKGTTADTSQQITKYEFDKLGRKTKEIIDPAGIAATTLYSYDNNGNLIKKTDANTYVTYFAYDAANQLRYTVNAEGAVTENVYDLNGNVTRTIVYTTLKTTGVNALADLDTFGSTNRANALNRNTYFAYDKTNHLRYTVNAEGVVSENVYDANGNVIRTTQFNSIPSLAGNYSLSNIDSKVNRSDLSNRDTNFIYDKANRLRFTINAEGAVTENVYDANGNIIATTQYDRVSTASFSQDFSANASGLTLPATNYSVAGGRLVMNSIKTAAGTASTFPQAWGTTRAVGTDFKYEFITDGSTNNHYGTIGLNSTDWKRRHVVNQNGGTFYVEYIDAAGAVKSQALGAIKDNTAYVLEIESDSNGTTLYLYENGKSKTSGFIDRRDYSDWKDVATWLLVGNVAGFNSNSTTYLDRVQEFPNGVNRTTNFAYDKANRLRFTVNAEGYVSENVYYANGNVKDITQFNSRPSLANYSESTINGAVNRSDTANRTTSYIYDKANRQKTTTLAGWYDPATGKVEGSNAAGRFQRTIEVTYDSFGNAVSNKIRTGAGSGDFVYQYKTYDKLNREVNDIDGLGHYTQKTYDSLGNIQSITRFDVVANTSRTISYEYTKLGQQKKVTQPDGGYTESLFNSFGEVTKTTQKLNATEVAESYFYYDKLGRQTLAVDAKGYGTQTWYNSFSDVSLVKEYVNQYSGYLESSHSGLSTITAPNYSAVENSLKDRVTVNSYNRLGQVTNVKRAIQTSTSSVETLVSSSDYNAFGEVWQSRDALNNVTTMSYDKLGQMTKVVEPQRLVIGSGTDVFINQMNASPETTIVYDAFGQRLSETRSSASGGGATITIEHQYDLAGNEVATKDGVGNWSYQGFDVSGKVIRQSQAITVSSATSDMNYNHTIERRFEYDKAGRQIATVDIYNGQQAGQYNDYNGYGEVKAEYKVWGSAGVTAASLMGSGTNNAVVTSYFYNSAGRVEYKLGVDGYTWYFYDLAGRTTKIEQRGKTNSTVDARVTEMTYNKLGQATQQRLPAFLATTGFGNTATSPQTPVVDRTYDRWGNTLTETGSGATLNKTLTYNQNNQVLTEEGNYESAISLSGSLPMVKLQRVFEYNKSGQLLKEVQNAIWGAGGQTSRTVVNNTLNAVGQIIQTTDAMNVKQYFAYDIHGNRVGTKDGIGYVTVDDFDANGQITQHSLLRNGAMGIYTGSQTTSPTKVMLSTFRYDQAGRRYAEGDATSKFQYYRFDERNNVVRERNRIGGIKTYEYDELGHKTRQSTEVTGSYNTYPNGPYGAPVPVSYTTITELNRWSYKNAAATDFKDYEVDLLSNRTISDTTSLTYDYSYSRFGQTEIESLRGTTSKVTYSYWGNGLQRDIVETVVSGYTTNNNTSSYYYDVRGNRTVDYSNTSINVAAHTQTVPYGGTVNVEAYTSSTGNMYTYYQYDSLNRVTAVQSPMTNVTISGSSYSTTNLNNLTYGYDEWGNRRKISATYTIPGGSLTTKNYWYAYDLAGRVTVSDGIVNAAGTEIVGSKAGGTFYRYDDAGRRTMEETWSHTTNLAPTYGSPVYKEYYTERAYSYNDLGLVGNIQIRSNRKAESAYTSTSPDMIGVWSQVESNTYDNRGFKTQTVSTGDRNTSYTYNDAGNLLGQTTKVTSTDRVDYSLSNYTYDTNGNILGYRYNVYDTSKSTLTLKFYNEYFYTYINTYTGQQVSSIAVNSSQPSTATGKTANSYDNRGRLVSANITEAKQSDASKTGTSYRRFAYNAANQIIMKAEMKYGGDPVYKTQSYYYSPTGGELANLGAAGMADITPLDVISQGGSTPGSYTVNAGDTLMGISQALFGDANLWYLIADANGLSMGPTNPFGGSDVGRNLRIPNNDKVIGNTSTNWKPYNPTEIVGDLTPDPRILPPPKNKCAKAVSFVSTVVAAIVAAVVAVYTGDPSLAAAAFSATKNYSQQYGQKMANGDWDFGRWIKSKFDSSQYKLSRKDWGFLDPLDAGLKKGDHIDQESVLIDGSAAYLGSYFSKGNPFLEGSIEYSSKHVLNRLHGNKPEWSGRGALSAGFSNMANQYVFGDGINKGQPSAFGDGFTWSEFATQVGKNYGRSALTYGVNKAFGVENTHWNGQDTFWNAVASTTGQALAQPIHAQKRTNDINRRAQAYGAQLTAQLTGEAEAAIASVMEDIAQKSGSSLTAQADASIELIKLSLTNNLASESEKRAAEQMAARLTEEQNRQTESVKLNTRLAAVQQQSAINEMIVENMMNNRETPQLAEANLKYEMVKQERKQLSAYIDDMNSRQLAYEAKWGKPADTTLGQAGQVLSALAGAAGHVLKDMAVDALYYGTPLGNVSSLLGASNESIKAGIDNKVESFAGNPFTGGWGDENMVGAVEVVSMFTPLGLTRRGSSAVEMASELVPKRVATNNVDMFRKIENTGDFAGLKVPMQSRYVDMAAQEGGIGLDGIKVRIERNPELIGKDIYGHASESGVLTLYPDAFKNIEELIKTLGHERTHLMQYEIFGHPNILKADPIRMNERMMQFENAAHGIEDSFWQYYLNNKTGRLGRFE